MIDVGLANSATSKPFLKSCKSSTTKICARKVSNRSIFVQGPRQQFNVEECDWRIQEGARPIQLIFKSLWRTVCDLLKRLAALYMLGLSFLQQIHSWSRDLAACVTWPTPCCSQNNQTPTFQSKENASTMADQRILCCFSPKVSTPTAASILNFFCALRQTVEGEKCACIYFQVVAAV